MKTFLIYGSYGYTGQLIADLAVKRGLKPVLAGQDEKKVRAQAESLNLEYRSFSLDDTPALYSALREVEGVLHCAGPFVHTFRQMAEACLVTRRHYIDISGEILGFETLAQMDEDAKRADVMLMPGVGFDVVPTDCLAMHLKKRLLSATHLRLYIRSVGGGFSRGTARSAIENMHRGGMIRLNKELVQVPSAWQVLEVDFGRGPVRVVSIGWGDVSTAYHSTGIPNIQTYMAFPPFAVRAIRTLRVIGPLLYTRPAKGLLKQALRLVRRGPTEEQRRNGFSLIVGEAFNDDGGSVSSKLKTPEAYNLTAQTAVEIMRRILVGDLEPGFQTPSLAYGPDFILGFEGVERVEL
ncbi:MAG: saccharopine dehydrogenase NADP-binding domain-containing protein, partial [Anaerolineales bacterium]